MIKKQDVETIKSCPFCKGRAILYKSCVGQYKVMCVRCKCSTKFFNDRLAAITLWNRRASHK